MGPFFCSPLAMPRSNGYRCNTRDLFSRPFRQHGMPNLQTYLTTYKVGDYVDVVANSAIQKGMPHKYYHGKTGIVWNVTPRAVGVEHVQKSKCREHLLTRVKENENKKRAAKENNQPKVSLKRDPGWPSDSKLVRTTGTTIENVTPLEYE